MSADPASGGPDEGSPEGAAPADCISVAVSLHQYEAHIVEALDSVRAQTHPTLDLIVVDDASTDRGPRLVEAWLARHAGRFRRARLIRHARNLGLSATRNTAFAAAETAEVFVLDADNLLYPSAIAKLHAALAASGAAVAYSQIVYFGDERGVGHAAEWDRAFFKAGNYVDAMALVSKAAWQRAGGYAALDLGWEDFDLWLGFIELGLRGVYVPEMLCRYRVHRQSMLRTITDTQAQRARVRVQLTHRHPWLTLD